MSKLIEYRMLENHLAEQVKTLNFLKSDERLIKELEFESKLLELLAEYSFSLRQIVQILEPRAGQRRPTTPVRIDGRSRRKLKVYRNPHTGELVRTKGGNHRTLKQWKSQHGAGLVESWLAN